METEKRMLNGELRALPKMVIEGKIPANEVSIDMGGWDEKISPYAFLKSLRDNIFLLYQHKTEVPLASTKSGTLKVWYDDDGNLYFRASLADTSAGRDLYNLVKSGVIVDTSFGMTVKRTTGRVKPDMLMKRFCMK